MHADEFRADAGLVGRLLVAQFPRWAALPLRPFASAGTDNTIYRLGDDLCVRLPLRGSAAPLVEKECAWLPRFPALPLTIPTPLAMGEPSEDYPWRWSVVSWIPGTPATIDRIDDPDLAARKLADFLRALQAIDAASGPPSGPQNHFRGVPMRVLDGRTRPAISNLADEIDVAAATALWEAALAAEVWSGPPVWVHGDLQPGNMLAREGRIAAVIDFGLSGVGDPACDLIAAWTLLPPASRIVFRTALDVDDSTWMRGRGWALYAGVIALDYYRESNPSLAASCRRTLRSVLADA
ncbi:MAG: aminoglycoside phosphotransferase family protein [Pseudomonadota bacterium]